MVYSLILIRTKTDKTENNQTFNVESDVNKIVFGLVFFVFVVMVWYRRIYMFRLRKVLFSYLTCFVSLPFIIYVPYTPFYLLSEDLIDLSPSIVFYFYLFVTLWSVLDYTYPISRG